MKDVKPNAQRGPLSDYLIIANLRHPASGIRLCAKSIFRPCLMKLHSDDSHKTTEPLGSDKLLSRMSCVLFVFENNYSKHYTTMVGLFIYA